MKHEQDQKQNEEKYSIDILLVSGVSLTLVSAGLWSQSDYGLSQTLVSGGLWSQSDSGLSLTLVSA